MKKESRWYNHYKIFFCLIAILFLISIVPLVSAENNFTPPTEIRIYSGATPIKDSLATKVLVNERIATKTSAIYATMKILSYPYKFSDGKTDITIKKIEYNSKKQLIGLWIEAQRDGRDIQTHSPVWIYNCPILFVDSSSLDIGKNERTTTLREDPRAVIESVLAREVASRPLGKPIGDDVLIVYPTHDQYITENTDAIWATVRGDTGDGVTDVDALYTYLLSTGTSDIYDGLVRSGLTFNTAGIGAGHTITDAKLWLNGNEKRNDFAGGSFDLSLVNFAPVNKVAYVATDYAKFGTTRYAADIAYAAFIWGWNTFTLTDYSAIDPINADSTVFGLRFSCDTDNAEPTWGSVKVAYFAIYSVDYVGTDHDPSLVVTYEDAATPTPTPTPTPEPLPDVIHLLSSCDSILWIIPDTGKPFGGTQIWRDDVYQYNLSNTTYYDSWSGLLEGTVYSISTRAYSINGGSFDKDWYNASAQTACCECAGLGGGCCGCGDSTSANILAFAPASLLVGVVGGYVLGKGEK